MSSREKRTADEQSAETERLIGRYHALTEGRDDDPATILAEDVVLHQATGEEERRGREAVVAGFERTRESFPDFSVEVHDVVAGADGAASRWTVTGTFEREFDGIEPTGETTSLWGLSMFRIEDGEIAEIWDRHDTDLLNRHLRGEG